MTLRQEKGLLIAKTLLQRWLDSIQLLDLSPINIIESQICCEVCLHSLVCLVHKLTA